MINVNMEIVDKNSFRPYKKVNVKEILVAVFPNKEITNPRGWSDGAEIDGIQFNTIKSSGKISIQMHFTDMHYKKVWRKVPIQQNNFDRKSYQIDETKLRDKHQELLELFYADSQAELTRNNRQKIKDDLQTKVSKVVEQYGLAGYNCRVTSTKSVQLILDVNPDDVEQLCKLYSELKEARK